MSTPFDLNAIIRKLAEMEWTIKQITGQPYVEGCIVPFKELRIPCKGYRGERGLTALGQKVLEDAGMWGMHTGACCGKRGWVPEPDVEKACWRIHQAHPYVCYASNMEEELRTALAWAEEQQKEMQHD